MQNVRMLFAEENPIFDQDLPHEGDVSGEIWLHISLTLLTQDSEYLFYFRKGTFGAKYFVS